MRLFYSYFLILVFLQICKCQHAEYEVCAKNLSLAVKENEIIFFKSLDFPQRLSMLYDYSRVRPNCSMYFYLDKNAADKRGILVFTNVIESENNHPKFIVFEKTTNLTFNNAFHKPGSWYSNSDFYFDAFQGFVLFDNPDDDGCPLESISKNVPYYFSNENEIISIQSSFAKTQKRRQACLWQFTAPKGYGFKLVFEAMNIQYPIQLNVENSTQVIYTERNVKVFYPYYNSDNYLKISLSQNVQAYQNELEFIAYISIIKNDWEIIEEKCTFISKENNLIIWKNKYSYISGYHNNAMCDLEIEILSETEVIVKKDMLFLEKNIDLITYFEDNETDSVMVYEDSIRLTGNKDGTSRNFTWQFLSDGSITSLGFQLSFKTIECKCKNPVIEICSDYVVLDTEKYMPYQSYCGCLNCNFTLQTPKSCAYSVFYVRFSSFLYSSHSDIYRIYSNNSISFEINTKNLDPFDHYIFLSTNVKNVLEIKTDISKNFWYSKIIVTTVGRPNIWTKLILDEENPYAEFDTAFLKIPQLNTFVVQSLGSDKVKRNATIEIYSNARDISMSFYSDETFEKSLNFANCFKSNSKYEFQCKNTTSKLVIYPPPNSFKPFLFFQLSTAYPIGCIFKENVFNIAPSGITTISAMANEKGFCRIFILIEDQSQGLLEFLYTSAKNENVKVFSGASTRKPFFEFNFETTSQWKTVIWNTRIYTIDIPQNSFLLLKISGNSWDLPIFNVSSAPYKAIFSTADYGIESDFCGSRFQKSYEYFDLTKLPGGQGICITILDFNATNREDSYLFGSDAKYGLVRKDKIENLKQTFSYFDVTFEFFGTGAGECFQNQQEALIYFEVKNIRDCYNVLTQLSSKPPQTPMTTTFIPQNEIAVPICTAVTFSVDYYNKSANKLIFTYSIDLNITENASNMPYSNDVTMGNFSYWSFDETLYYPRKNEWCIYEYCLIYPEHALKRDTFFKNRYPDGLLRSVYYLKQERSNDDFTPSYIFINNGQFIDKTKFFDSISYPCNTVNYGKGTDIEDYPTICCTNYDYIKIPASLQFSCNIFEVNTEITKNDTIQALFNATLFADDDRLYIHNNEFTSSVYKNYTFGGNTIHQNCKNNFNMSNQECWLSSLSYSGFYEVELTPKTEKFKDRYTLIIAKYITRNGILLKDDHTPFTPENPCWKQYMPIPYRDNLTVDTSFCCTSFVDVSSLPTTNSNPISTTVKSKTIAAISTLSSSKSKVTTDSTKFNTSSPNYVYFFNNLILIFIFYPFFLDL